MTVYIALGMIFLGVMLWPLSRGRRSAPDPGALRGALSTRLARELWRQSSTPSFGLNAVNQGSPLLPILGYELYPRTMRRVYDLSRKLDAELLKALLAEPEDDTRREHVEVLQGTTRRVRRRLMIIMTEGQGEPVLGDLDDLKRALDGVNRALRSL